MAAINDLIRQITDPDLRDRIQKEVDKLAKQKKFGLVFEEHLPECTPLYDIPVRRGVMAALKDGDVSDFYQVLKIDGGKAICIKRGETEAVEIPVDDLVTIAEFGKPIYPYLKPIDTVCNAPDSDLWHTLIEADNYHALQLLEYLYAGKVDCIYIDPPYNTGAHDWKYNNDYVDETDAYRHSRWLSMMQKRLCIAKTLLSKNGVLICAIDQHEFAKLALLLEEIFPRYLDGAGREGKYFHDYITVVHNPRGQQNDNISYVHETLIYIYPSRKGKYICNVAKKSTDNRGLRDSGTSSDRTDARTCFYPFIVKDGRIVEIGEVPDSSYHPLSSNVIRSDGKIEIWPIDTSGREKKWRYSRDSVETILTDLFVKCTNGVFSIVYGKTTETMRTVWQDAKYDASEYGTKILKKIFCEETAKDQRFSYAKSIYAEYQALFSVVSTNPNALVVDFFAGSGTTLHALNLLNLQDNGNRRCILVTNNEVSENEARELKLRGYKPGDHEWEKLGIAQFVTWPRTVCSIEGHDVNGNPLKGNYLVSDAPMANGFKANVAFFKLGFLDKTAVALGMQFKEMLPLLWMKAGAKGKCPEIIGSAPDMLILPENKFAVLTNENIFASFEIAVQNNPEIQTAFIVTDYEVNYRAMVKSLNIETSYQLYRDYLDNFRINHGRN